VHWTDHGTVLEHGLPGDPDATATWTGSVVRDPSGHWRMYYTGSRFLSDDAGTNVETVLMAVSDDLHRWEKEPATVLAADPEWYEKLADATWHEEAWRDPWIVRGASDDDWHMLVTARSRRLPEGLDPRDRGVIGHAVSADRVHWRAAPPLSAPGAGFAHLEVLQLVEIAGRRLLVFSCDSKHLAGARAGLPGGIWVVPLDEKGLFAEAGVPVASAYRVTGDELYAGRAVARADGTWALLGFENVGAGGEFVGRLSDPVPIGWDPSGRLVASSAGALA
jgi:beta-fructofuranosidase